MLTPLIQLYQRRDITEREGSSCLPESECRLSGSYRFSPPTGANESTKLILNHGPVFSRHVRCLLLCPLTQNYCENDLDLRVISRRWKVRSKILWGKEFEGNARRVHTFKRKVSRFLISKLFWSEGSHTRPKKASNNLGVRWGWLSHVLKMLLSGPKVLGSFSGTTYAFHTCSAPPPLA